MTFFAYQKGKDLAFVVRKADKASNSENKTKANLKEGIRYVC